MMVGHESAQTHLKPNMRPVADNRHGLEIDRQWV